jgi:hypothetical protein
MGGMGREHRSREWWTRTVAQWRRSGLTATDFALQEDLSLSTLRWWSSAVERDTRAQHGSSAIQPIEISVGPEVGRGPGGCVEIAVGRAVVRCEPGVDVAYVAALVRALDER